jgi:hypothetical protein
LIFLNISFEPLPYPIFCEQMLFILFYHYRYFNYDSFVLIYTQFFKK